MIIIRYKIQKTLQNFSGIQHSVHDRYQKTMMLFYKDNNFLKRLEDFIGLAVRIPPKWIIIIFFNQIDEGMSKT